MDLTVTIATVGGAGRAAPARSTGTLQSRDLRRPTPARRLRQAQQSEKPRSGRLRSRTTRCVDFGERLSESPLSLVWTLVRKAVDPSEGQNAQNQRVARVIPWT